MKHEVQTVEYVCQPKIAQTKRCVRGSFNQSLHIPDYSFDYLAFENNTSAPEKCAANNFGDFCARLNVFFYNDLSYTADCGRYRSSPWWNKATLLLKDDCYLFITKNCDAGSWLEARMSDKFVVLKYSKEHKDFFSKMSEEDIGKITQVVKKAV